MARSRPPEISRSQTPLVGFRSLQRMRPGESTSDLSTGSASGSHTAGYGAVHRVSHPLDDLFLSSPSRHFQTGGAPGIHPSGVCSCSDAPAAHRQRACLLDVSPMGRALPSEVRRLQGLQRRRSRSAPPRGVTRVPADLPLLGFRPLMVCTHADGGSLLTVVLHAWHLATHCTSRLATCAGSSLV